MKVSFWIIAYDNFTHLERLIQALGEDATTIYVHIDKKTKQNFVSDKPNVKVIKDRVISNWGSFGMVQVTLDWLNRAHGDHHDYYINLSGAGYASEDLCAPIPDAVQPILITTVSI